MIDTVEISVFLVFFIVFIAIGFLAKNFRKGNLNQLPEWALGGRRLGTFLVWFLVGADLYTAYTFIAVPSSMYSVGSVYFFAVPYVSLAFAIAMLTMPKLWAIAKEKGYVTAGDFVKDRFNSESLAIVIALTGIVAELPYIALQIVGMRAILTALLHPVGGNVTLISNIALVLAFLALIAFTYTSGLRGASLTAVMKDIIIFTTVIVVIVVALVAYHSAFTTAFTVKPVYADLPPKLYNAYWSLFLMSAAALYLYPHAINGSLSSMSAKKLRLSTALLPIYGIGLAFLALFGVIVYGIPAAESALKIYPSSIQGALVVPTIIASVTPQWFTGFAFLGIFIGGLVPAAIMSMSQATLLTRNVIRYVNRNLEEKRETFIAKLSMVFFQLLALGFVFIVPETYAISLQLIGGIIILQTLPAVFLGMYVKHLEKYAIAAGWLAGIASGVYFEIYSNFVYLHYSIIKTTLMPSAFGLIFVGLTALVINLVVVVIGTAIVYAMHKQPNISKEKA
ncbi:proline permease [Thermoplasma volcanium GSS1]|uniref:Proline permease n=1 Tax=Thermoplasma volcanium (strain ATCC 51530 / DSM 4299 / JCM 9571 / NBRC 15438 / GSS1) TaxID=273116 RepID=Q978U2_THEVO|nr:sodium:solute symporter [Thermoplasma volcanium]BAB60465.1 proline permease [Thermoplasma volcanium GSS1]